MAPPLNATSNAGLTPLRCGFGRTHIGANRYEHADVSGQPRKYRADHEANSSGPVECEAEYYGKYDTDAANCHVLAIHVRLGAFLNG